MSTRTSACLIELIFHGQIRAGFWRERKRNEEREDHTSTFRKLCCQYSEATLVCSSLLIVYRPHCRQAR